MNNAWLSEKKVDQKLSRADVPTALPELFWLSHYYERAVFCTDYIAPESVTDAIRLTSDGIAVRDSCVNSLQLPLADVTLAIFDWFPSLLTSMTMTLQHEPGAPAPGQQAAPFQRLHSGEHRWR